MGGENGSNKVAVLGISSILLVAAVVGTVTYAMNRNSGESEEAGKPMSSNKAVNTICTKVDYKDACVDSLSDAKDTSDPKELVKVAFNFTVNNLAEVIKNSSLLKEAARDPRTSDALETCKELLNNSMDDFQRSFDKVETFDLTKVHEYVADLKTWLSGAITYQLTCLDAFVNTTGDTGEKMQKLLTTSTQLSSNGLAMVDQVSDIAATFAIPGFRRRLMSENSSYPDFVGAPARELLQTDLSSLKPNATIAQDGSGTHKTLEEAIKLVKKNNEKPFVIHVKEGVYKEYVEIPRHRNNIYIIGEGPDKTKITGNKNFIDGTGTYRTPTVAINGDGCILKDIAIENTAGAVKHQAVALRVSGDKSIIHNCRIDGYQDTLYSHSYRQFYRDTTITGTIDFIFGDASAVFQNCTFIVRKPMENQGCMVTAQGRNTSRSMGATILQNCTFAAEPEFTSTNPLPKAYLGRPWKEYSRTIIMQCYIGDFIDPEGWSPWQGDFALDTLYYGEYNNTGPGADTSKRVQWKGIQEITPKIAESFTAGTHFMIDDWIKSTGVPYEPDMFEN